MQTRVSLKRCENYDPVTVRKSVVALLDLLGGARNFFAPGARVLLKPNFLTKDKKQKGIITHPVVIRAVAEIALDCGCKVAIGDSPGIGSVQTIVAASGYEDFLKKLPVKFVEFKNPVKVSNKTGGRYRSFEIEREVLEADLVVNMPKVKTHGQMLMSLAVKNIFGTVVGARKVQWHLMAGRKNDDFARMIVELCGLVAPKLNIADGIVGMEGNGPSAGTPKELGFLAASSDPFALDVAILKVLGVKSDLVYTVREARSKGLVADEKQVEIVGDDPELLHISGFKLPSTASPEMLGFPEFLGRYFKEAFTVKPWIENSRCTRCLACVNQCPAGVMELIGAGYGSKGSVKIDYRRCIRCYCCQEICPEEAIELKQGWLLRLISRAK